ncbi:hypothetical protein O3G_MSEX000900 [Manduca sexta]|nr:hypothetical protein O3G_MSEX000900 [Manduca sexta]
MNFDNKVVIVTGASTGIGAATAIQFAKEGADVTLVGRNEDKLTKVSAECAKYGKNPLVIKADVSKDDEAKTIVARTIQTFGKLDVLVNNAGIFIPDDILEPNYMETFDLTINTNLRPVAQITNQASPISFKLKGTLSTYQVSTPQWLKFPSSRHILLPKRLLIISQDALLWN